MAKLRSRHICQQCGYSQVGWAGKCPSCGTWDSLVESVVESKLEASHETRIRKTKFTSLSSVPGKRVSRISTKISELDRVLGGGLVEGQVVLIAGEPGIGKSTLLLQVSDKLCSASKDAIYVSGEESALQIKIRADRLKIRKKGIKVVEATDIDRIIEGILDKSSDFKRNTSVVVVDSIQTMVTSQLSGMAGSVGQVRECAYRIVRMAKEFGIPVFIVGHVTKEGTVAGPSVLAHMVDTVLWFEGDKSMVVRILRAVKNRFGPTDEVGLFSMEERGLVSVSDSSKLFLSDRKDRISGSVLSMLMEGTRPFLVEIQSLVIPTKLAFPRRIVQGIDSKRVELIIAVLQKHAGVVLQNFDVFVNVTGGIRVKDTAADLAIALSISSSYFDKPLSKNLVSVGEIGLLGEIRKVVAEERRVKEARRLGYRSILSSRNVKSLRNSVKKCFK
jgi:DNA repair protein RadA/Sms